MNLISDLPVNKWNLLFHSEDLEAQYQRSQMAFQLLFHKTMMLCGTIVCLICLIVFVAQSQPLLIILQMVASLVAIFSQLLLSNILLRYTHQIYAINYLSCIVVGQYISQTGTSVPQYILGHTYCIILICCLRLCHNKIKGVFIIATPVVILLVQDAINLENIYIILYFIEGTICLGFVIYLIEYQARKAFFSSFTAAQYSDLLQEFTNDGLFALSLNDRSQQFILEFHNTSIIKYCEITGEIERKNFLRNSFIVDLQTSDPFKRNPVSRLNLEDYLFQKMKGDFDIVLENKKIINEENNTTRIFQITLKIVNLRKKVIFISLQSNQFNDLIHQQKQIKKNYQKIIVNQSLEISVLQQKFLDEFNKLNITEKQRQQFLTLKCINLQIRNILNNYLVYFQQDKILHIIQDTINWRFHDFMTNMTLFFTNYSSACSKRFKLTNQLPFSFSTKINYNILSQILINLFESILTESIFGATITLLINGTNNLNPIQMKKKMGHELFTHPEESSQSNTQNNQFLIHFSFTYEGSDQHIDLNQEYKCYQDDELIRNTNISAQVTNILLGKIGPYNSILQNNITQFQNMTQFFVKHFFIYADLTQLEQTINFKSVSNFL